MLTGTALGARRPRRTVARPLETRPSVTVVIPMHNYGRYVGACLASVLAQPDVDLHVIVADDASSDDGLRVVQQIAAADARVQVIANERNLGHIPTLNKLMRLVQTKYVVKLDADDLLAPGALARATALMEHEPSVGFVYGRYQTFSTEEPPAVSGDVEGWTIWPGDYWLDRGFRRPRNPIQQPEVLIRTATLRTAGEYREDLPHTSDYEMWMRLAAISDVGRLNSPVQGFYRMHGANMSQTVNGGLGRDLVERQRALESFFSSVPTAPTRRKLATANRALAREARLTAIGVCLDRPAVEEGHVPADERGADMRRFAVAAWPAIRRTPGWLVLSYVQRRGDRVSHRHPVSAAYRLRTKYGWAWATKRLRETGLWGYGA